MERVLILSGLQLSTNPRVVKEADTLATAGYDVEVVGVALDPQLVARDKQLFDGKQWRYTTLLDASSHELRDRYRWAQARTRMRVLYEVHRRFGVSSPRRLGYAASEMRRYALRHPADLTIVHNPQGLWVGVELLRHGRKIAVDFEDWYSEDLLPQDRSGYTAELLRRLEAIVLRGAAYSSTTSRRLSEALASSYQCVPPVVLYNSFSWAERASIDGEARDRVDPGLPSVCWFSQVVGPGRGLEALMDALPSVNVPFEIHLRGNARPAYRDALLTRAPQVWRDRIHFHDQVPHAELLSRLAEHDLALAGELPDCRSRALTITNKVLQYLLAGVPVLASDTEGQREVAERANGAVALFAAGDSESLAAAIDRMLSNPELLREAREKAALAAERHFCWERAAPMLLDQVRRALPTGVVTERVDGIHARPGTR